MATDDEDRMWADRGVGEEVSSGIWDGDEDEARLERRIWLDRLYDRYAPLLTDRQRDVYEMLHFADLAPTEAAQALGVTRQAVHILYRRVTERLETIEGRVRAVETIARLEERIRELEGSA